MIHRMRLHSEPFKAIKSGIQRVETRLYDEKRRKIKVGDKIVFIKRPKEEEMFTVKVVRLSIHPSFKELFESIPKTEFGYSEKASLEAQINNMRKYYSEEEEEKSGVIGICLKIKENI